MRMLVKFVCVAIFLIGCMSKAQTMIIMLDKDGKPIKPNYPLLARDLPNRNRPDLAKADAQLKSDRVASDASGAPAVSDIGSRLRSAILEQTQENAPTRQAQSLISLSSGGITCGYGGLSGYGVPYRSSSPENLSPEVRQRLHEEYQALLAQIDAMQSTSWNGSPLFAGTQIHNNPHIGLNSTNHFPTIQNSEEHKGS